MIKVFFDHQCYWEKYGGVSRYFTEILKTDFEDAEYELALKYSNNEYLDDLNFDYRHAFNKLKIPKKHYLISAINKPYTINAIIKTTADIIHLTHYDPYLFKYAKGKIVISTIHDLNFFAIPQFFSNNINPLKKWQMICAEKSDFLITISENSKKDLMRYLDIDEQKIKVIYHGVNDCFKKDTSPRIIKNPYILFVGRREGYKNFKTVLKAFANIKNKDLFLVCTGLSFSKKENDMINAFGVSDRIINISASEYELINLYSHALLFVYPSLYEGFGFPLLEAMGCECPVLCSDTSCFPEIAEDAALYFNPYSAEDCIEKMNVLIDNQLLRNSLIQKGLIQKQKFSWNVSRQQHFELYKSLKEK